MKWRADDSDDVDDNNGDGDRFGIFTHKMYFPNSLSICIYKKLIV
jgi:hypothetical protein